ncbi:MAG: MFS transporter [Candidatus Acidiferrales bacterium]
MSTHVHVKNSATSKVMPDRSKIVRVLLASAGGTVIEWYDFYIFGSLTAVLSVKFYPPGNDVFAYVAYLATFAVGFLVRPFGALIFGPIGDRVGRKYAFLFTLLMMGGATVAIGLLPTFKTAGWIAPIALIAIRVVQGLALGGEYGGAAVYVAEHVPDARRGFYTSFIQLTGVIGFLLSLMVILGVQQSMSAESFAAWGWRIPFLASLALVSVSIYIRLKMSESPVFEQIKAQGMTSAQPLKDAFGKWENLRSVLISLFGATAGLGVIFYTGQFYALFYLQTILRVPPKTANIVVAVALVCAMPFMIYFGALSDRLGRKWIMVAACGIAIVSWMPIYRAMQHAAGNNVVAVASAKNPATGAITLTAMTLDAVGNRAPAAMATNPNVPLLIVLVFLQVLLVCMAYGPIAAYLVEAFPAKVRYTSMSLPYHIGNGVFGGMMPLMGLSLCAATGNIYAGLYYPMTIAAVALLVGAIYLPETHRVRMWDEVNAARPPAAPTAVIPLIE